MKDVEDIRFGKEPKSPIFEEIPKMEARMREIDKMDREIRRDQFLSKLKVFMTMTTAVVATSLVLQKASNYERKPIDIVTYDILANNNMLETDNGDRKDSIEFDLADKMEMYNYMINNDLSFPEVIENIKQYCVEKDIPYDEDKIKETYSQLFEIKIEIEKDNTK